MAQFQILDKEGDAITIDNLDKEVCELWNKEYSTKNYANPFIVTEDGEEPYLKENWYDSVGWSIAYSKTTTWSQAIQYFAGIYDLDIISCCVCINTPQHYLYPYLQLFQYWEKKGYKPSGL